ncbi:MAG: gliding motility-associated C-terminal domain-containing protein, partial [Ferruginibacter sp.]|nr:gliding motility-associated C-terminal domain-containing protein [Ferruginibacter sp.]
YTNPGVYQVRLIAANPNTCNLVDTSAYFTITVLNGPVANASWSPNPPIVNMPTNFTNLSTGAISFLWNFGDGESSTAIHPTHQYNASQAFSAALIAYNNIGCTDTFFLFPRALILPALDVPNAFTPGKFGINSSINVVGFGIGKMDWKIYNRWGQLVFQSASNKQQGWDGTFKGKPQPMDVYTYTLDVIFTDGKKLRKTGDITLIR